MCVCVRERMCCGNYSSVSSHHTLLHQHTLHKSRPPLGTKQVCDQTEHDKRPQAVVGRAAARQLLQLLGVDLSPTALPSNPQQ